MTLNFLPTCSAVLGGSTEGDQTSFVSSNASILIFEEVLKKLLSFIRESSFDWVRDACSMLNAWSANSVLESKSSISMAEMAHFALRVLDGSFFHLKTLVEDNELVPDILAAVLVIDLEYRLRQSVDNASDNNETNIDSKARLAFGESVHAFSCKRRNQFRKSLGINNLKRLGSILIQCIRSAIFNRYKLKTDNITSFCCSWMLEFFSCFCEDQLEEQDLLDQLLSENDMWPLWIVRDFSSAEQLVLRKASVTTNVSDCNFGNYDDLLILFCHALFFFFFFQYTEHIATINTIYLLVHSKIYGKLLA